MNEHREMMDRLAEQIAAQPLEFTVSGPNEEANRLVRERLTEMTVGDSSDTPRRAACSGTRS